jgi:hypothetical protein
MTTPDQLRKLAMAATQPGLTVDDTERAEWDLKDACSPERILQLLDVIDALREQDKQLSRVLHELAGSASVCWKDGAVPTGEFNSTQACELVANAIEELRGFTSAALARLEGER